MVVADFTSSFLSSPNPKKLATLFPIAPAFLSKSPSNALKSKLIIGAKKSVIDCCMSFAHCASGPIYFVKKAPICSGKPVKNFIT